MIKPGRKEQPDQFMNATIIGTVVQAGTDENGRCRIIIETEPEELKKLPVIQFYKALLIGFRPAVYQEDRPLADWLKTPEP